MFETLLILIVFSALASFVWMYYKELDNSSNNKRNFRNDGQSHLIF